MLKYFLIYYEHYLPIIVMLYTISIPVIITYLSVLHPLLKYYLTFINNNNTIVMRGDYYAYYIEFI